LGEFYAVFFSVLAKNIRIFVEKVRKTTIFFFVKNLPFSTPYTHQNSAIFPPQSQMRHEARYATYSFSITTLVM
jgi:hypothetical protein